jgi:flagellar biosynthesis protein FliR
MEYFVYNFQAFLLVLIRMHSMFMIAPLFSSDIIPFRTKTMLAFLVAMIAFPMVMHAQPYTVSGNMGIYALMVLREVLIGLYIGFLASVIFSAFQLAGQYFAVQIGFGFTEVVDPLAQISIPIVGQLKNMLGILVFLFINGHHFLISAVVKSYTLAPVFTYNEEGMGALLKWVAATTSGMFVIALKISLPIVATVFLVTVAEGMLSKAAPQMNIMMLGFPLKILVAFGMLAFLAPLIVRIMKVSFGHTFRFISDVLVHWPG